MELNQVINNRFSVRSYLPDRVEQQKLDAVLDAAVLAPTAVNYQAFKIVVIDTQSHAEALKTVYKRDWFVQAPYVLAVCVCPEKCYIRRHDAKNFSDVDAAIVMDHIILAATEQGLGTCWIGAFDPAAAKTMLKLDDRWEPIVFTPLGYSDAQAPVKKRKAKDDLVTYLK